MNRLHDAAGPLVYATTFEVPPTVDVYKNVISLKKKKTLNNVLKF